MRKIKMRKTYEGKPKSKWNWKGRKERENGGEKQRGEQGT